MPPVRPRQFCPLSLTAGKRRRWLAKCQISESDASKRFKHTVHSLKVTEELRRFINPHFQNVGN